jgi:hypothetical protein
MVFHEESGRWFGRTVAGALLIWGGSGFIPVAGDYKNNGRTDLAVYANGYWFMKSVAGEVLFYGKQWSAEGFEPVGR